jgi:hypothetical protein
METTKSADETLIEQALGLLLSMCIDSSIMHTMFKALYVSDQNAGVRYEQARNYTISQFMTQRPCTEVHGLTLRLEVANYG